MDSFKKQSGFALPIAILIAVVLIAAGGTGYYFYKTSKTPETPADDCEKIIDSAKKNECYIIVAIETKNSNLCEKVTASHRKHICYADVAIQTNQFYSEKTITITGVYYDEGNGHLLNIKTKDNSTYAIQTHPVLIYVADLSNTKKENRSESMEGSRDIIEMRVSRIGVEETIVQVVEENIIVVEPMISPLRIKEDFIDELRKLIGKTPFLEFRLEGETTGLTGKYLMLTQLDFDPKTNKSVINLRFTKEGEQIFGELFAKNVGKELSIYLDEISIYRFVIQNSIPAITGDFTIDEAKQLIRWLNAGALPVPMALVSHQNKIDIEELRKLHEKTISVKGYLMEENLIDIISFEAE